MILLIDNYDSFSYNLYQLIGSINPDIKVVRNDELSAEEVLNLQPEKIIISPGPGRPEDAGNIIEVIQACIPNVPILGVCLGHQAICAAHGATVDHAHQLMHGKQSLCDVDTKCAIFAHCNEQTPVARYHSLSVVEDTLPSDLQVCARAQDGEVMAVRHVNLPVFGVQFHPESILTPEGATMIQNFLAM